MTLSVTPLPSIVAVTPLPEIVGDRTPLPLIVAVTPLPEIVGDLCDVYNACCDVASELQPAALAGPLS
jgi:hypothetical protein